MGICYIEKFIPNHNSAIKLQVVNYFVTNALNCTTTTDTCNLSSI